MPLINRAYNEQDIEILERLSLGETALHVSEKTVVEKRAALQAETAKP